MSNKGNEDVLFDIYISICDPEHLDLKESEDTLRKIQEAKGFLEKIEQKYIYRIRKEILNSSVDTLNIDTRTKDSLKRAGVFTIKDILNSGRNGLLQILGIGYKSLRKIEEELRSKGLDVFFAQQ